MKFNADAFFDFVLGAMLLILTIALVLTIAAFIYWRVGCG